MFEIYKMIIYTLQTKNYVDYLHSLKYIMPKTNNSNITIQNHIKQDIQNVTYVGRHGDKKQVFNNHQLLCNF